MRTIGYIENLTQADITHLAGYIKSSAHILFHPLTLPEIFLHEIMIHLNERIRIPIETEFYEEERRTGLSRVNPAQDHNAIWKWGFVAFQESTRTTNRFITALAYLRRRYAFAIHLTRRFLTIMDALQTYEYTNPETKAALEIREHERRERLQNRLALLENYEHQTECVSKRAENLITVVCQSGTSAFKRPPLNLRPALYRAITDRQSQSRSFSQDQPPNRSSGS
jgi:hypothetical protein